jgi:hypothetical protein
LDLVLRVQVVTMVIVLLALLALTVVAAVDNHLHLVVAQVVAVVRVAQPVLQVSHLQQAALMVAAAQLDKLLVAAVVALRLGLIMLRLLLDKQFRL